MWMFLAVALAAPQMLDAPLDPGARLAMATEIARDPSMALEAALALAPFLDGPDRCTAAAALAVPMRALPARPWVQALVDKARGCVDLVPGAGAVPPLSPDIDGWRAAARQDLTDDARDQLGWAWVRHAEAAKGRLADPSAFAIARRAWLVDLLIRPGRAEDLGGLAGLEWDAGEPVRALQLFEAGLSLEPANPRLAAAAVDLVRYVPDVHSVVAARFQLDDAQVYDHIAVLGGVVDRGLPVVDAWRTFVAGQPPSAAAIELVLRLSRPVGHRSMSWFAPDQRATWWMNNEPFVLARLLSTPWWAGLADPRLTAFADRMRRLSALADAAQRAEVGAAPSSPASSTDLRSPGSEEKLADPARGDVGAWAELAALPIVDDPVIAGLALHARIESGLVGGRQSLADAAHDVSLRWPDDDALHRIAVDAMLAQALYRLGSSGVPGGFSCSPIQMAILISPDSDEAVWHRVDARFVAEMAEGNLERAARLLGCFPKDAAWLAERRGWLALVQGQRADAAGDVERALRELRDALETHPHAASVGLATIYARLGYGDLAAAHHAARLRAPADPGDVTFDAWDARLGLARVLVLRGRPEDAFRVIYGKADLWAALAEDRRMVAQLGAAWRAHHDPAPVIAAWEVDPPADPLVAAGGWLDLGQPERAWQAFHGVLREHPDAGVPWSAVVAAAAQSGHLGLLEGVAAHRGGDDAALWRLATATTAAARPADLAALTATRPAERAWLADAWLRLGQPRRALRTLGHLEAVLVAALYDDLNATVDEDLVRARALAAAGLVDEGVRVLKRRSASTHHPRYAMALADILRDAGRPAEAAAILARIPDAVLFPDGPVRFVPPYGGAKVRPVLPESCEAAGCP
jgi:tetratricopeptide (TPR) repeat protein